MLARLGNPQDKLPPVIHIAGTNGKGSTTAFLRAIAEAHGKTVHVDTSPHLIRVNERIRVAGHLISDDDLRRHIDTVLKANNGEPLSFFEGMTVASFLAFTETPADLTLVEVGLGGRFDSTNVFDAPAVSVITPIAFDHREFLGRHLSQIAWEKAGIIKPGCPVVSATQTRDVHKTLLAEASFCKAQIQFLADEISIEVSDDGRVSYQTGALSLNDAELGLTGPHQRQNAALAILALKTAGLFELEADKIKAGLKAVTWPARLQKLDEGPLTAKLPGKTVYLDGGHNPHAANAISEVFRDKPPVAIILSMLATKDARSFISNLSGIAEQIIAIPLPSSHRCQPPDYLASLAEANGVQGRTAESLDAAIEMIGASASDTALIAGSLYMAGDVLRANQQIIT